MLSSTLDVMRGAEGGQIGFAKIIEMLCTDFAKNIRVQQARIDA